jgi:hypothetical protein
MICSIICSAVVALGKGAPLRQRAVSGCRLADLLKLRVQRGQRLEIGRVGPCDIPDEAFGLFGKVLHIVSFPYHSGPDRERPAGTAKAKPS